MIVVMRLLKHFLTVGLSTALNILLSFFTTPIITRIVEPEQMGKFTIFNTYVTICASLLYFGLNEALMRFYFDCKNDNDKRSLLKLCFLVPFITAIFVSLFAFYLYYKRIVIIDFNAFEFLFLCLCILFTVWERMSNEMLQNTFNSKQIGRAHV